jgi:hypothetical protein
MIDDPEFSVPIPVDRVPADGMRERIEADAEALAALAARFDIPSIEALRGDFQIRLLAGGPMIRVTGTVSARATRTCVVTGAPLPEILDVPVEVDFAPAGMVEENIELTLADADPPEALRGDHIDLGELAAQQMALVMDPYPRSPEADLSAVIDDLPAGRRAAIDDGPVDGPFAKLSTLRKGREDG